MASTLSRRILRRYAARVSSPLRPVYTEERLFSQLQPSGRRLRSPSGSVSIEICASMRLIGAPPVFF